MSSLHLAALSNHAGHLWPVVLAGDHVFQLAYYEQALPQDLAKHLHSIDIRGLETLLRVCTAIVAIIMVRRRTHHMLVVKPVRLCTGDEKLAAIGIWAAVCLHLSGACNWIYQNGDACCSEQTGCRVRAYAGQQSWTRVFGDKIFICIAGAIDTGTPRAIALYGNEVLTSNSLYSQISFHSKLWVTFKKSPP